MKTCLRSPIILAVLTILLIAAGLAFGGHLDGHAAQHLQHLAPLDLFSAGLDPAAIGMLPAAIGATQPKRFRVATSGPTIDGREIKPEWLTQAAANYDPKVYAARINIEHLRGYTVDSPFGAFGDVTALSTQTNKQGRVELYADLLPNDKAIAANQAGQKVYSSIEVVENFAGTGQAYVIGLALTDSPASIGTERLSFSAKQLSDDATYTAKPFTGLGEKAGAQAFGMANPIALDFAPDDDTDTEGAADKIKHAFAALREKFAAKFKAGDKAQADLATEVAATLDAFADATADQVKQLSAALATATAAHDKLSGDFAALVKQLETTPAGGHPRPASSGGSAAGAGALADY